MVAAVAVANEWPGTITTARHPDNPTIQRGQDSKGNTHISISSSRMGGNNFGFVEPDLHPQSHPRVSGARVAQSIWLTRLSMGPSPASRHSQGCFPSQKVVGWKSAHEEPMERNLGIDPTSNVGRKGECSTQEEPIERNLPIHPVDPKQR